MFLVIFGPPGSGKGTQTKKVTEAYGIRQIITGEIFREHIKKETPLGKKAKKYVNKGLLVPDEIINAIVEDELKKYVYKNGIVLDGYPRTINQVEFFEKLLRKLKIKLDCVLNLVVDEKEVVRRLTSRRTCSSCQSIFNSVFNPPKKQGTCDSCGGKLVQRDDDKEDVIKKRLGVYNRQTKEVLQHYKKEKILMDVDGKQNAGKVFEDIEHILDRLCGKMIERTLVIIKPDGIRRRLADEITRRYESAGLKIIKKKTVQATQQLLRQHYSAHVKKPFYAALEKYMMGSPVIAMIVEGENAISRVREITGVTDPSKAAKGTIRGDLGNDSVEKADKEGRAIQNLIHASGNKEEAEKEIKLWFG